jgi:hypothetical protein
MYERFISSSMLTGTRDWVSDMRYGVRETTPESKWNFGVVANSEVVDLG